MDTHYDFNSIEPKWQQFWQERQTFRTPNPGESGFDAARPKYYVLDMFPYPSGAGLHVGHPEGYTATDILARYRRMKGFNVLHPMGWDAFGLPAEQYAIETNTHPRITTERNIARFREQLRRLGFSYDWSREFQTTADDYVRWTQWIFLLLFNHYYDPAEGKARPIAALVKSLENERLLVDMNGEFRAAPLGGRQQQMGVRPGLRFWHELPREEQRDLIDRHRLAYLAEVPVNWCPALGTVLANEEVTADGRSERGDHPVFRRPLKQWMLRITAYAQRLEDDLAHVDWPESVKLMQRNWIGRSVGAEIFFPLADSEDTLEVFTTRPDTLYGATYMVLAPEHPLVESLTTPAQRDAVRRYVAAAASKDEQARLAESKDKTGVFTGVYAINPVWPADDPRARIPIWVADYVLMGYGTGAIMGVPAHDTRDLEFARRFDLPVLQVVQPPAGVDWAGYVDDGVAVNSPPPGVHGLCDFNGLPTPAAKEKIIGWLAEQGIGERRVNYKLRDWLFSRQRYWGEPFPIVHCGVCGPVAVPDSQLPVTLPDMDNFQPTAMAEESQADPEPPLARATGWTRTVCPDCGRAARRELNTMPNWAGSCWYYLRFADPRNESAMCGRQAERYWFVSKKKDGTPHAGGVDLYVGGTEHAVLHLLYARFWHKVLFDLGHVSTPEPFGRLFNQGMIRAFAYRDGRGVPIGYDEIDFRDDGAFHKQTGEKLAGAVEKMSKSLKNVVNPDDVVADYGADSLRLYEMFMGPLEASKPWNPRDVPGVFRFLQRAWRLVVDPQTGSLSAKLQPGAGGAVNPPLERALHKLVRKVTDDLDRMAFNTAIAAMMEFVNAATQAESIARDQLERFVLLLSPFAPHISEELWQRLRGAEWCGSLAFEAWPAFDPAWVVDDQVEIAVQVNGKLAATITVPAGADEVALESAARANDKVQARLAGKTVRKVIVIKGRLVNVVGG
ncbi:MAG: leucine--tRNA ligase [Phycisphaerae bacterium]